MDIDRDIDINPPFGSVIYTTGVEIRIGRLLVVGSFRRLLVFCSKALWAQARPLNIGSTETPGFRAPLKESGVDLRQV